MPFLAPLYTVWYGMRKIVLSKSSAHLNQALLHAPSSLQHMLDMRHRHWGTLLTNSHTDSVQQEW